MRAAISCVCTRKSPDPQRDPERRPFRDRFWDPFWDTFSAPFGIPFWSLSGTPFGSLGGSLRGALPVCNFLVLVWLCVPFVELVSIRYELSLAVAVY